MKSLSPSTRLPREWVAIPSINPAFPSPPSTEGGERQIALFISHYASRFGLETKRQSVPPGRSNVVVKLSGGIPSVIFGPGDITQAHTAIEWISLNSLERATHLRRRFLESQP